jgi:hypothetical protein
VRANPSGALSLNCYAPDDAVSLSLSSNQQRRSVILSDSTHGSTPKPIPNLSRRPSADLLAQQLLRRIAARNDLKVEFGLALSDAKNGADIVAVIAAQLGRPFAARLAGENQSLMKSLAGTSDHELRFRELVSRVFKIDLAGCLQRLIDSSPDLRNALDKRARGDEVLRTTLDDLQSTVAQVPEMSGPFGYHSPMWPSVHTAEPTDPAEFVTRYPSKWQRDWPAHAPVFESGAPRIDELVANAMRLLPSGEENFWQTEPRWGRPVVLVEPDQPFVPRSGMTRRDACAEVAKAIAGDSRLCDGFRSLMENQKLNGRRLLQSLGADQATAETARTLAGNNSEMIGWMVLVSENQNSVAAAESPDDYALPAALGSLLRTSQQVRTRLSELSGEDATLRSALDVLTTTVRGFPLFGQRSVADGQPDGF